MAPPEDAGTTQAAFQALEHGLLIWRADTVQMYVLDDGGSLAYYGDTWDESQPADDPGRVQQKRSPHPPDEAAQRKPT